MTARRIIAGVLGSGLLVALLTMATVDTAANSVPPTRADQLKVQTNTNDLKPSSCRYIDTATTITGALLIIGSGKNDLILGSEYGDVITGLGGDDCIVGGDGNDYITAGGGSDVCIGGPGNDTFVGCETAIQ